MVIHLMRTGEPYDLFEIFAIPESRNDDLHYWNIETNYIAVSENRTNYLYLSFNNFEARELGFCSSNAPVYNILDMSSSIIATFTKNEDAIAKTAIVF